MQPPLYLSSPPIVFRLVLRFESRLVSPSIYAQPAAQWQQFVCWLFQYDAAGLVINHQVTCCPWWPWIPFVTDDLNIVVTGRSLSMWSNLQYPPPHYHTACYSAPIKTSTPAATSSPKIPFQSVIISHHF